MYSTKKAKHQCGICNKIFDRPTRLTNHQKKADSKACDVCDTIFCHESELERHKRTVHTGQGISAKLDDSDLDQPICPRTGLEGAEGYKEEIDKHWGEIRDKQTESKYYTDINKELTPDFTYRDLQKLLVENTTKQMKAFKINIGFGFMLRHITTEEYRYFYPSSNNLLFERMITIATRKDITSLMKRLIDLDLTENYYMKRPASGWVLAGLPNVQIKIIYLTDVVFD